MPNYLKEAFKELELLNEETFSFDKDGAAELKKFYDGDTTDDYESIIDPEAETKDELEDSYEGKVIIACKICHGMQYKDPQDIVIDEESDYVNVGEECPACSSVDGYKIVGQVAPYCAECDEVDESAIKLEESTWNFNITRMPKVAASKLDKINSSGLWDDFLDEMDDNTESITVHTDEYRIVKGTSDEVIAHDKKIMWDLINKYYNKALKKSKGESLSESYVKEDQVSYNGSKKVAQILGTNPQLYKDYNMMSALRDVYLFTYSASSQPLDRESLSSWVEEKFPGSRVSVQEVAYIYVPNKYIEKLGISALKESRGNEFDVEYVVGGCIYTDRNIRAKDQEDALRKFNEKHKNDRYPVQKIREVSLALHPSDEMEVFIDESLNEKRKTSRVIESLRSAPKRHFKESLNEEKLTTLFDVVGGMLDGTMDRITINKKTGKKQAVGTKTPYEAEKDIGVDDDGYFVWVADEAGAKYAQGVADKFGLKTKLDAPTKYIRGSKNRKFHIYIPQSRLDEPVKQVVEESCGRLKEGYDRDILIHDILSKLEQEGYDVRGRDARAYADGAAELIMISPDGYTVDKWFEDTKRNHSEDLLRFKKFSDLKESGDKLLDEFGVSNRKVEREKDAKTKGIGFSRARKLKQALEKDLSIKVSGPKVYKFDEQPFVDVSLNFEHPTVGSVQFVVHCENPDYFWVEDDLGVVQKQLVTMEDVVDFIGGVLDGKVNPYGMNESVKNVKVETDSDTVTVTPTEGGDVKVETQSKKTIEPEAETIVPVDDKTKDEIDMNDNNFDETDVDIDIDSIDDEGFDTLSESYLKKVYENVKSFKTSSSSIKDGKLMVEGIISFNSGKKAKTSFVFESISKTKRGKIKFLGENLNFSKSKSAFTLIAKPVGKKAVCESLTYNYVAKDSKSNKKLPVYGKVSK